MGDGADLKRAGVQEWHIIRTGPRRIRARIFSGKLGVYSEFALTNSE